MKGIAIVAVLFGLSVSAFAGTIRQDARDLQKLFWDGSARMLTQSQNPLEMVREFIPAHHGGVFADRFVYRENFAEELPKRKTLAGTLELSAAERELLRGGEFLTHLSSEEQQQKVRGYLEAKFQSLREQGAVFGFDAFYQNSCGDPVPYLFILDTRESMLYGLDLRPCAD